MNVIVKYGNLSKEFNNQETITIGKCNCDIVIPEFADDEVLKLVYAEKYNNYVLMNLSQSREIFCNNKVFSKILVNNRFVISSNKIPVNIEVLVELPVPAAVAVESRNSMEKQPVMTSSGSGGDIFDNNIEKQRIAIIKEIGFRILELKNNIKSTGITSFILNVAMVILSVVSSFGITNFLLGFKIDNTSSVLNLTTNFGFLTCVTAIVAAICLILKQSVYSLLDFNANKRFGDSNLAQKFVIGISSFFLFIVYV
ncbi:MAG: hypothetical protein K2F57_03745, partial [Candidatus Gastranaerophilales bacterium]|nr:hypothetical protein [Candidatus Gastranaerophilales bacterium]